MTRIWTENGFADSDAWIVETDEQKAGEGQRPLLGLEAFLAAADATNDGDFGVLLKPADDVRRLAPHLGRLALVAVAFPAFNDGRGFSQASLLRDRLRYQGELRAVGDVLIDQIPLMQRTGFDSFAVTNATALKRLADRHLTGIAEHYQPAARGDGEIGAYSWRRRAAV
ncbi:DUF934 domain-containing protein [Rhizobium sp. CG5]|uniref:DUF934 domain-containing protein n=1 Tax=Rhizobium sp. CG5 TaxID=2726076 RepID=UPI0020340830|nr:DUF934 domain-containing protein [Rhizobium sp. CG5]MCM2474787.1 DUF934 domain-containing protein [Rhizobium sp. CG5]